MVGGWRGLGKGGPEFGMWWMRLDGEVDVARRVRDVAVVALGVVTWQSAVEWACVEAPVMLYLRVLDRESVALALDLCSRCAASDCGAAVVEDDRLPRSANNMTKRTWYLIC